MFPIPNKNDTYIYIKKNENIRILIKLYSFLLFWEFLHQILRQNKYFLVLELSPQNKI